MPQLEGDGASGEGGEGGAVERGGVDRRAGGDEQRCDRRVSVRRRVVQRVQSVALAREASISLATVPASLGNAPRYRVRDTSRSLVH